MSHIVEDAANATATRGLKRTREEDIDTALEIRKQAREHRRQSRRYIGQMREQVQLAYESALIQLHQSAAADAREEALDAREEALDASESDFKARVEAATMLLSLSDDLVMIPRDMLPTPAPTSADKIDIDSPEFAAQVKVYAEQIRAVLPVDCKNILTVWMGYYLMRLKSPIVQQHSDRIMRASRDAYAKDTRWDMLKPLMKTIPLKMRLPALGQCGRLCRQATIMADQVFQLI